MAPQVVVGMTGSALRGSLARGLIATIVVSFWRRLLEQVSVASEACQCSAAPRPSDPNRDQEEQGG